MFVVVIEIMHLYDDNMIVIIVKNADSLVIMIYTVVYDCKLKFNKHDTGQTILFLLIMLRYRRLSGCELMGDEYD